MKNNARALLRTQQTISEVQEELTRRLALLLVTTVLILVSSPITVPSVFQQGFSPAFHKLWLSLSDNVEDRQLDTDNEHSADSASRDFWIHLQLLKQLYFMQEYLKRSINSNSEPRNRTQGYIICHQIAVHSCGERTFSSVNSPGSTKWIYKKMKLCFWNCKN